MPNGSEYGLDAPGRRRNANVNSEAAWALVDAVREMLTLPQVRVARDGRLTRESVMDLGDLERQLVGITLAPYIVRAMRLIDVLCLGGTARRAHPRGRIAGVLLACSSGK